MNFGLLSFCFENRHFKFGFVPGISCRAGDRQFPRDARVLDVGRLRVRRNLKLKRNRRSAPAFTRFAAFVSDRGFEDRRLVRVLAGAASHFALQCELPGRG